MASCAVATCKNYYRKTKGSDVKYFKFPDDEDLAKKWISACRRDDTINLKSAKICSIHFEEKSFEISLRHRLLNYNPKANRNLKSDAVPVLNLPGSSLREISEKNGERRARKIRREEKNMVIDLLKDTVEPQPSSSTENPEETPQNKCIGGMASDLTSIPQKLLAAQKEQEALEASLSSFHEEGSFYVLPSTSQGPSTSGYYATISDTHKQKDASKTDVSVELQPASSEDEVILPDLPSTSSSQELSVSRQVLPVSNIKKEVDEETNNEVMQPFAKEDSSVAMEDPFVMKNTSKSGHDPTVMPDLFETVRDPVIIQDSLSSGYDPFVIQNSSVEKTTSKHLLDDISDLYSCKIRGRRIVDLEYLFKTMKELNNHSSSKCNLNNMCITKEQRLGLLCQFEIKCTACKFKRQIFSEDIENTKNDINADAVGGVLSISGGFEDLRQFLKALKIPPVTKNIFQNEYKKISSKFPKTADVAATKQSVKNPDSVLKSSLPVKENVVVLDNLADILIENQTDEVEKDNAGSVEQDMDIVTSVEKEHIKVSGIVIKHEIEVEEEMSVESSKINHEIIDLGKSDEERNISEVVIKPEPDTTLDESCAAAEKSTVPQQIGKSEAPRSSCVFEQNKPFSQNKGSDRLTPGVEMPTFSAVTSVGESNTLTAGQTARLVIKPEPGTAPAKSCAIAGENTVSQQIAAPCALGQDKSVSQGKDSGRITLSQEVPTLNLGTSVGQGEINRNTPTTSQTPLSALGSLENYVQGKIPGQTKAQSQVSAAFEGIVPSQGMVLPPGVVPSQGVVLPPGVVPPQGVVFPPGIVSSQGVVFPQAVVPLQGFIQSQFNPSSIGAAQTPFLVGGLPIQSTAGGIPNQQMAVPMVHNVPYVIPAAPANIRLNLNNDSNPTTSSSSFFTLPGGAPKNMLSQVPSKPNSSQSDKQPKRPCYRCEDCDVTFAKSESLDSHLKNYCIKRLKIPPSSTVTSQNLEKLSHFPAELLTDGSTSGEIQSCISVLNLAMINKRSALEASVKAASEAQYIINNHNLIKKEKERIFKDLNDAVSRETALAEEEVVDTRIQVLARAQAAYMNEKYSATSVEQALCRQKAAIEAAVIASTQEQMAFIDTMKAFKEQLIEKTSSAKSSFHQEKNSVVASVCPTTNQRKIFVDASTNATELLKRVSLGEGVRGGVSEKSLFGIAVDVATNQQMLSTDASTKPTEMGHRVSFDAAFKDKLSENTILPLSSLEQEKNSALASVESATKKLKIVTEVLTKATEMPNQISLDVASDASNEPSEFSTSDRMSEMLHWNNISTSNLQNNISISSSDSFNISNFNNLQERTILNSSFLGESVSLVNSAECKSVTENIASQDMIDVNRTDLGKYKVIQSDRIDAER